MRFDRRAGGHNFDFDTDVCTRCGIDRRWWQSRMCATPRDTDRDDSHLADAVPSAKSSRQSAAEAQRYTKVGPAFEDTTAQSNAPEAAVQNIDLRTGLDQEGQQWVNDPAADREIPG